MKELHQCAVCHKILKGKKLFKQIIFSKEICNLIKKRYCRVEMNHQKFTKMIYTITKNKFIHILLESEKGGSNIT